VKGVEVRKPDQLQGLDSLIIPGGESTTMAKLANYHNLVGLFLFLNFLFCRVTISSYSEIGW
jgi:glutamine amidotransferase PdxT